MQQHYKEQDKIKYNLEKLSKEVYSYCVVGTAAVWNEL